MKNILSLFIFSIVLFSCKSSQKAAERKNEMVHDQQQINANENAMQAKGIDFFAHGNFPVNWSLQMNYDDTVKFVAEDGIALRCAYNQLKKDLNAQRNIFTAKISGGDLTIVVDEKPCTITTEKQVYTKSVTVTFNTKAYTGCGKYLADNTLNGKWILDKIGNATIIPADYNKVPTFTFDVAAGRVSGNDGCNAIGSKMEVQGNRIKFSQMISTKMACLKKNIEPIIAKQIDNNLVNYYFKDGELFLYLLDDSVLVFKKG